MPPTELVLEMRAEYHRPRERPPNPELREAQPTLPTAIRLPYLPAAAATPTSSTVWAALLCNATRTHSPRN